MLFPEKFCTEQQAGIVIYANNALYTQRLLFQIPFKSSFSSVQTDIVKLISSVR